MTNIERVEFRIDTGTTAAGTAVSPKPVPQRPLTLVRRFFSPRNSSPVVLPFSTQLQTGGGLARELLDGRRFPGID